MKVSARKKTNPVVDLSPMLDVIFQLRAEGTVIPCVCKTAVYLTAGENEASVL